MATKKYNHQYFTAKIDGKEIEFHCWTTDNPNGFCHYCNTWEYGNSRCIYYNRTWERFTYESVLLNAIDKFPKKMQEELRAQIIDRKNKEEEEKCNAFFEDFKKTYDGLSDKNKEILRNSPEIQTEEQAKGVLAVMKMMSILG